MGRRTVSSNNGRIAQFSDSGTGEVVNYTYDALNRLIAATTSNSSGPVWGESYTYDGFGNLLSKVPTQGTAPQVYTGVNSSTNQMGPADANGNWLGGSPQFAWDVENRMVFSGATDSSGNWVTYSYDPWGKRVLQYASAGSASTVSTCVLYFYGANGKRLGTYNCGYSNGQFTISTANINVYFGKKLIASGSEMNQNAVFTDRLGSVRGQAFSASIAYFPYGEERTSTPDNTDKFGTYFRDGYGQDYADQRYYTAVAGRFWSPDPGALAAADPRNPLSWNQYTYGLADPANHMDPSGLDAACGWFFTGEIWIYQDCGGGTGGGYGGSGGSKGCLADVTNSSDGEVVAEDDGHGPYSPGNGSGCRAESGAGGAGGGFSRAAVDAASDQLARGLLNNAFKGFAGSNCNQVFATVIQPPAGPGYTTAGFESEATTAEFYNVTNSNYSNLTQNQVSNNGSSASISTGTFYGLYADSTAITIGGGTSYPAVLLGAEFFSNPNTVFQTSITTLGIDIRFEAW